MSKQKQPQLVLPNYPYKNRFSTEQINAALERKDRLVEAMMDPVGPDGTLINLPMDMLHILGFHLAYAGADVFEDLALIESRVVGNQGNDNEYGLTFEDMREWRPRGDFGDEPTAGPEVEARALAAQVRSNASPEVRKALAKIFADEFGAVVEDKTVSEREAAENVLLETRELKDKG